MVVRDEFGGRFPHRPLAQQDHPLQAGFLNSPYNRSAWAFKLGVRGGNFTEATPQSASLCKNSDVNNGSRS
jgi:hypothetical protein